MSIRSKSSHAPIPLSWACVFVDLLDSFLLLSTYGSPVPGTVLGPSRDEQRRTEQTSPPGFPGHIVAFEVALRQKSAGEGWGLLTRMVTVEQEALMKHRAELRALQGSVGQEAEGGALLPSSQMCL